MKNVLFVDDESINLMLYRVNYRNRFAVFTAETADDALVILRENSEIEVIITDMKMPGMSGLEFAHVVQKEFAGKKKVYILTGFGLLPEIEQAINDGIVSGYVGKPLNFNELGDLIDL